jgi:hypothetical protein
LANFKYQSGDHMSAIQVYLVHKNRYRAIFGSPALSLDSAQDRQTLADSVKDFPVQLGLVTSEEASMQQHRAIAMDSWRIEMQTHHTLRRPHPFCL